MKNFDELKLNDLTRKAIAKLGFTAPTPIQAESIPVVLKGQDVIACAQTGSGKTLAFGLPLLEMLLKNDKASGLILAPTRELAQQISEVLNDLMAFTPHIQQAALIGGISMRQQLKALERRPRIVIATPGRLTDHLRRGSYNLNSTKFLVLDEGDRLLDMGFAPQLDVILKFLKGPRQTLLFSATMSPKVRDLARKYLTHPVSVTIGGTESRPPEAIKQTALKLRQDTKNATLLDELNQRSGSVIIFTRTKHRADRVARYLEEYGFAVTRIHGNRTQGQRNKALQGFRDGEFRILVATDIAARGIDVNHIAHVINYDLPMLEEDYVHRIGRTARAGATGEALSFVTAEDKILWLKISRKFNVRGTEGFFPQGSSQKNTTPTHQQKTRDHKKPSNQARHQADYRRGQKNKSGKLHVHRSPGQGH